MKILQWIQANRPGSVKDAGDRFEVAHDSGEHSTLWKRAGEQIPDPLRSLSDCYTTFDGMDLFSSTFKLASIDYPQEADGVRLTFTLDQLSAEVLAKNCSFPDGALPFMYQAGIGYYAVDRSSGTIYEWDTEDGGISEEFESFESVLDEWVDAVT